MILYLLFYFINFLIGITTKLLFKTDSTFYLRNKMKDDLINYLTDTESII